MTYATMKACAASARANGHPEFADKLSALADELARTAVTLLTPPCARCAAARRLPDGRCALCGEE